MYIATTSHPCQGQTLHRDTRHDILANYTDLLLVHQETSELEDGISYTVYLVTGRLLAFGIRQMNMFGLLMLRNMWYQQAC